MNKILFLKYPVNKILEKNIANALAKELCPTDLD